MMAFGCGTPSETTTDAELPQSEGVTLELELPDSLFKLKDQKITFKTQNFDFEDGFKAMDSIQKLKLLQGLPPFAKGVIDEAYFVSSQNRINGIHPIVVYGSTENYGALLLLTLDAANKVVAYKEIAGGFCAAPVQHPDRIQWCDDKLSDIINDSMFVLNHLHLQSPSSERINEKLIDSVKYLLRITPAGQFEQLKKDSTRYYKVDSK